LLSRRLRQLKRGGVIEHDDDGGYRLTSSGLTSNQSCSVSPHGGRDGPSANPNQQNSTPTCSLWWLHRRLDPDKLPGPRFTIHVNFSDHPKRYWIVVDHDASLCLADPRFDIDVTVRTDRSTLYRTYLGHVPLAQAHRSGRIALTGSRPSIRPFIDAFQPSPVASIVHAEAPQ